MLRVIEYRGKEYYTGKRKKRLSSYRIEYEIRDDYIRFEWDNGHLDMQKYIWDKLPKKKKELIYKLGELK